MVLVKCDRHGNVKEIDKSDSYVYLVKKLESITEKLESDGIMLINKEVTKNLSRTYEFSSSKNGWECVFVLAHDWVKGVKKEN